MKCVICAAERANYRCRTCRSAYCSSQCYKIHRMTRAELEAENSAQGEDASPYEGLCEAIVAAQQPDKEREEKRRRVEAQADVFSDLSREKAAVGTLEMISSVQGSTSNLSNVKTSSKEDVEGAAASVAILEAHRNRVPPSQAAVGLAGNADAIYILQEKHLAALAHHPRLRSALRSPELQKLIRTIDGSRSRLDALSAAQHNNADFDDFCHIILRVIAEVEGR